MKYILDTKKSNFQKEFSRALNSKRQQSNINRSIVLKIINDVKRNGDQSLIKYSKKFDKIDLNKKNIQISNKEIISITSKLDPKIKKAINLAYSRVKSFHLKQVSSPFKFKDKFGNQLGYKTHPSTKWGFISRVEKLVIRAR
jgi:histidinol dehydrogenase